MPDKEEQKAVFKEAIKEWMDDKFLMFGKWSAGAIGIAAFSALMYFIYYFEGWKK